MTVAELIAELGKYPPDMSVVMNPYLRRTPVLDVKEQTIRKGEKSEHTFVELSADVFDW